MRQKLILTQYPVVLPPYYLALPHFHAAWEWRVRAEGQRVETDQRAVRIGRLAGGLRLTLQEQRPRPLWEKQ